MNIFDIISLIFDGLIVLTGFSAVGLYLWQQHSNRRTAATLIVTQVDQIEESIKHLQNADRINNVVIYKSKRILAQNYWENNRHILSRYLGESNMRLIEDFYSCAEEIEKAREAICREVTVTWENKDFIYQRKLIEEIYADPDVVISKTPLEKFADYGNGFTAALPSDMLKRDINQFQRLSGTVAYDKLRKLSYHS